MNLGLNMDNKGVNDFPTKDIYLATALKVNGEKLIRVDMVKGERSNRAIFVFDNTSKLKSTVTSYMNRELKHECQELFETWKQLKSLVFSTIGDVR